MTKKRWHQNRKLCGQKVTFRTREEAEAVAAETNKDRVLAPNHHLQPYPCPWAKHYHLGHVWREK